MISVHMFRLPVLTEVQPRWKKGCATQIMTTVASRLSSQVASGSPTQPRTGTPTIGAMVRIISGTAMAMLIQSRRVKSISSWLGPSDTPPIGSSAMPQTGQVPGPSCTTSGSMGQV